MSVSSRHNTAKVIGQRKAFCRQRIPESSCARKETVEIDILVTSRNGDGKIMQSIRVTNRHPLRKGKWNQLSQFLRISAILIPIVGRLTWLTCSWSTGFRERYLLLKYYIHTEVHIHKAWKNKYVVSWSYNMNRHSFPLICFFSVSK